MKKLLLVFLILAGCHKDTSFDDASRITLLNGAIRLEKYETEGRQRELVLCNAPEQLNVSYLLQPESKEAVLVHTHHHNPLRGVRNKEGLEVIYSTDSQYQKIKLVPASSEKMDVSIQIVSYILKDTSCTYHYNGQLPIKTTFVGEELSDDDEVQRGMVASS